MLVCSSRLIFGQVWVRSESGLVILLVPVHPLVPGCAVEYYWSKFVVTSQVCVCEFAKNMVFGTFNLIEDGYAFIIVFEAVNPVINYIENFHRNSIEQADFCGS